jgi:hypothetical protein
LAALVLLKHKVKKRQTRLDAISFKFKHKQSVVNLSLITTNLKAFLNYGTKLVYSPSSMIQRRPGNVVKTVSPHITEESENELGEKQRLRSIEQRL